MKVLLIATFVEIKKAIKSKIFLGILFFAFFVAFVMGVLFFIAKNPEISTNSVILKAKSSMVEKADWRNFFSILNLMIAIMSILIFGIISIWVFGREYMDRTMKDLLALPVRREVIVLGKFMLTLVWSFWFSFLLFVFSILVGFLLRLEGWSKEIFLDNLRIYIVVTGMGILLSPFISLITNMGRGYLLPFGFLFLILFISNFVINISENAKYFPYAIPLLYAGGVLKEGVKLNIWSYVILFITGFLGFLGTLWWWKYVDQY